MTLVGLEGAFGGVSREVVWWALERVGVDGWLVGVIQSMYVRVTIAVGVVGEGSAEFWVGVGVRRGL